MYLSFANVLVFTVFGVVFVILNVSVLSRLLRPRVHDEEKLTTYECGEPPIGDSWVRFDIRFYAVALVFLVFDVEVAFLYPWGVVFRELAPVAGTFVFMEMLVFVVVLLVGFIYVWVKGDLDWIKSAASHGSTGEGMAPQPTSTVVAEVGKETMAAR
jgi:NADH-quinone oxidoreductase subunit A